MSISAPLRTEQPYRFPTDAEMQLAVCRALGIDLEDLRDGRRLRRVNHIIQMVSYYQRAARATGSLSGYVRRMVVAAKLWPNPRREWIKTSMIRWERVAEDAGLLRVCDGRGARALEWELLDGWQNLAMGLAEPLESAADGRRSSAGQPTCRAVRRRETRSQRRERRVRPHCRRVGNKTGSVGRLLVPVPFFKRSAKLSLSGLDSLRESNLPTAVRGCAAGRPPGGGLSDAQPPTRDPAPPAAGEAAPSLGPMAGVDRRSLVGLLEERLAEGGEAGLVELATAPGVDPVELALAGWELLVAPGLRARGGDGSPRLKRSRRQQLANACRVIDRVLEQPGAGIVLLLQALDREREQLELFDDRERSDYWPGRGSLGYFIVELRRVKSRWRRHWRDRRQASGGRRARGSGQGGSGA